jgi:hypothetical protein
MPKDVMTYQCNKSQQVRAELKSNNDAGSSSKGTWDEELSVGSAHKRLILPTSSIKMTAGKDTKLSKPLPPPNSDFYQLAEPLPPEELTTLRQVLVHREEGRTDH